MCDPAGRQATIHIVIEMQSEPDLLEIVGAGGSAGCLASGLDCGQQQGDQDSDNGDDDQEFDEGEGASLGMSTRFTSGRYVEFFNLHIRHLLTFSSRR